MAGNGQKVIDLDKQRMDAMAKKDLAALNMLISDDLVYTHSSARLDTKKSLIGNMESGVERSTLRSCRPTSRPKTSAIPWC